MLGGHWNGSVLPKLKQVVVGYALQQNGSEKNETARGHSGHYEQVRGAVGNAGAQSGVLVREDLDKRERCGK